ncbi:MAG: PIN domain-containing protein [Planctomycetota bacterium]|jgi:predicted nucleic acid-binding protein
MVFDTDVLIWMQRGDPRAIRAIDSADSAKLSAATFMELVEGVRDRAELRTVRQTMAQFDLTVLPLSEDIGRRATMYLEEFRLAHGLDLVDAVVAATAVENAETLCTANVKHYRAIPDLTVKAFRP